MTEVANQKGNRVFGWQFSIDESTIRGWRKHVNKIQKMPAEKLADSGGKSRYSELKENLKAWILVQRNYSKGVSTLKIRLKASAMSKELLLKVYEASQASCETHLCLRSEAAWLQEEGV